MDENSCIGTTRDIQVNTRMNMSYLYVPVYTMLYKKRNSYTGMYRYMKYHFIDYFSSRVKGPMVDISFRLMYEGMHLPCTVQHILMSKVKKIQFSECAGRTWYHDIQVHSGTYQYIMIHTHKGHNHFSLQIRPYPLCDAGEFPNHA
jgi:hypothetical protein